MLRAIAIWGAVGCVVLVPVIAAGFSPLLQWRDATYIFAGIAGIAAMAIMPLQPLAAAGVLPGLSAYGSRRLHRAVGASLFIGVVAHVAALWITSPPDVLDALLFRSPALFSPFGVIAMAAVFAAAVMATPPVRRALRWRQWRRIHRGVTTVIVAGTIAHVALIEGTMDVVSKTMLCLVLGALTGWSLFGASAAPHR
ncbi:MAG: ferric reductase-like transmembrane domain-containing protein [Pseudomonadota bacterium]